MLSTKMICAFTAFIMLGMVGCGGTDGTVENKEQKADKDGKKTVSEQSSSIVSTDSVDEIISTASDPTADIEFVGSEAYPAVLKNNGDLYVWSLEQADYEDGTRLLAIPVRDIANSEDTPQPYVILSNVREFDAPAINEIMAITEDSALYSWGNNGNGRMGCGDTEEHSEPVKIMDNVREAGHCYAITNDNELYVWGDNKTADEVQLTPQKVMDDVAVFKQYHMYENNTFACFALISNGDLYSWGNIMFCLGTQEEFRYTPELVMENVRDFSFSDNNIKFAVTNNDELYVWGAITVSSENGEIEFKGCGDTKTAQLTPVKILSGVRSIASNGSKGAFSGKNVLKFVSNDNVGAL